MLDGIGRSLQQPAVFELAASNSVLLTTTDLPFSVRAEIALFGLLERMGSGRW